MIYTVWSDETGEVLTLVEGETPPTFANGTSDPTCQTLLHRIEADSWEEANHRYHQFMGWEE